MARNTALITDAAQAAASKALGDYAGAIAGHVGGDWAGHSQARVTNSPYTPSTGACAPYSLRMLLTLGDTGVAAVLPALYYAPATPLVMPLIALQPQSQTVSTGNAYRLSVYAASPSPLFYQWKLNGADINAANASMLLITYANKPASGVLGYTVLVSNEYGSVLSNEAVVTVV